MSEEFVDVLKSYISLFEQKTPEEAEALIGKYPEIVVQGIMTGSYVAAAEAIRMKEAEAQV